MSPKTFWRSTKSRDGEQRKKNSSTIVFCVLQSHKPAQSENKMRRSGKKDCPVYKLILVREI